MSEQKTCESCGWWAGIPCYRDMDGDQPNTSAGVCRMLTSQSSTTHGSGAARVAAISISARDQTIYTDFDFGCIHHEPAAQEPTP